MDLKGIDLERAEVIALEHHRAGKGGNRAAASPVAAGCQERVDTKAFKGKGTRSKLRHLQSEVDRLEQHMNELVAASKKMPAFSMYLALHHRSATGYTFLRWREAGGDKRHLSWEAARALCDKHPPHIRRWYMQLSAQAQHANAEHVALRKELRQLEQSSRGLSMPLYPRPLPGSSDSE